ncbi:hypothetical protein [Paenibacillus sp. FSL H8-0537]|uniref:hypothetical protein n=1 Tax=Paenibacillus sp. FSL H8-0537 TaxID=2921399 RepID=UPI0031010646
MFINSSDYVKFIANLETYELNKELNELNKRIELVKSVISIKQTEDVKIVSEQSLTSEAIITENDLKYGLLRFSSNSNIAEALIKGSKLTLEYKGLTFECSVPQLENYPNQKGRINGLKKVYSQFNDFAENKTVLADFNQSLNKITIIEVK